ncbi:hypothetical protein Niako_2132 [Niastella koreensis GR20-10]|uniref:Uncharacterized protein n=1 Tax=Niastella koreensis (strain DSM 17620 / KACC 11465 / NBRC 106392 / GR20-10) TaxID=700598 RepID=G8TGP5_NIAKG|nr:hypothetical protein Niako_2132 [Niastella koreensis GR20-10]
MANYINTFKPQWIISSKFAGSINSFYILASYLPAVPVHY